MMLIIGAFLIIGEVERYGTEKSQSIALSPASKYVYDINNVFQFICAVYFYMDELVPVIQKF